MRPEDLETLRKIQWNHGAAFAAYAPWAEKMKPADRMIVRAPGAGSPDIPGLEWNYAATGLWIGRLPQQKFPADERQNKLARTADWLGRITPCAPS